MKIVIDPGHGGKDKGATYGGVNESDINLSIAQYLEYELRLKSISTFVTRANNREVSLQYRVRTAMEYDADLFVSVHCDAFIEPSAQGMTVFVYENCSEASRNYADKIAAQLALMFPDHTQRGVKKKDLYVLKYTPCPAVLIECEFLSNPEQREFLTRPENQKLLAQTIMKGL